MMERVRVAFDALPFARWGPLFHVLCLERPEVRLEWKAVGYPTAERSLLEGVDVGLFAEPPAEAGLDSLVLETSEMAVAMAVGHPLARSGELGVADLLDEPFPGSPGANPEWRAFWTLDEHRGGPPNATDDDVTNVQQGLEVVASGRAIATFPASLVDGLPHPGLVAVRLTDGPAVTIRLVWRSGDPSPAVRSLVGIARDMTRSLNGLSPLLESSVTGHHLEIQPLTRHRWVVRYEGDATPLSEHPTLAEAQVDARNHARQFGESVIHVHELDGEYHTELVDPDFTAPTPRDVKGPKVEP